MDSILKLHQEMEEARDIYVFDLPEEAIALDDKFIKKSVGLRKLTMEEELRALEIAQNAPARAGYFMLVTALVEVDDRKVNKGDGEDERIINRTDPLIRSLLVDGQATLSGPTSQSKASFLKSRRVKVG